ncbi:proline iminopeptidase-family hydrolase [Vagococcus sp. BWB3-3]|uniref:Proline iminopeptidase n=1 Tax=Vagococcus allomyrinae TaxID=2794353 RepID=A0A940PBP6_9ENTE|nr:proline iminopeptidase-family hydrolase [Vagococcus allomyrinae]MBP1041815.1 proline iminopeptidase-family hydrolase [Vagococcus allomyrinae]
MKISEGYMSYLGHKTYYRTVGESKEGKKPLVLIHGGPGSAHNYFELLDDYAEDGRMIVMYDQIGCGNSLVTNRTDLWHARTWIEELMALRTHLGLDQVHLLGQSWGGMLLIAYLCDDQPNGILSAIFSSTLPSAQLWKQEQRRMIKLMSEQEQKIIQVTEEKEDYDNPEYLAVNATYMRLHAADEVSEHSPEPLRRPKGSGAEAYLTAWGPNEYSPTGTLREFDYVERLSEIEIPVLLTSGTDDLSTPLINKTMFDRLPNVSWELFAKSRHMPFLDEKEVYKQILIDWLNQHD